MTQHLRKLHVALIAICLAISGVGFAQTTYTFNSGGQTGQNGPTQAQMDASYSGTSLDGDVTVTGGIQFWTVPTTGNYTVQAFGGQGYGPFGGRGAHITGEFFFTAGTQLKILVGQRAGDYLNFPATTYNAQYGGGGGSFVTLTDNTPLVVAGGGGGSHANSYLTGCDGQITEAGAGGVQGNTLGAGGTGGNGGLQASSADAGGGLLTNGDGTAGGQAFVNGGLGGGQQGFGGFGGGGGTSSWNNFRGGGGGGYSGGGAGNNGGTCCAVGGGGGSFNGGTNVVNLAGVQTGDGQVIISLNCVPVMGSLVPDAVSLPDVTEACVVTALTPPTASNSCAGGYEGTPDVTLPINTVGTTVVTWTYDDGANTITQTQNIVINGIDNDPPVINNPNLLTFSSQCAFTPPIPTATDVCAGTVLGTADVAFPITAQGQTTITWTYDDGSGNTVQQTQTVNINDVSPPVADNPDLDTYQGCNTATPPTPTATDNCGAVIDGVPDVTFPITAPGVTTVTWTYDDGLGNVSSQTQDVNVSLIDNGATANGTQLTATETGVTYQWIDCATGQAIQGATGQGYQPSVTGEYAVIVSNANCTDTSACLLVDFTGITELNSAMIDIYPNPSSSGSFTVDFDGVIEQIVVLDALGRAIELPVNLNDGTVDGTSLASGRYLVKVFTASAIHTKSFVVID